ncbi:virginiamycin A acetyltransferase [Cohaesibacter sp. ES.047]|uniref:CatB-related O-acetyltransferase n=1 Tax=Cohaesibacter sp. ES.047 TaxID=1798205 RepID=UPI000BB7218D|nr:CatB-related O-acetyltransferase [Cohaesibacter sp. ES.047]SNY90454.1 virginiamycin A acetyltransferase [Cohaesibacter sp. ES.047]
MQDKKLTIPNPSDPYPIPAFKRTAFLKPLISSSIIEVGDFTYYDDPDGPERFEENNVLYHYDFLGDRLIIGKFCALATGVTFIMNGANHDMRGLTSYPFGIMGGDWGEGFDIEEFKAQSRGDTIVGDDVWIGRNATILPGVSIGSGAIIASNSVVSKDVPAYGIVAGNPAKLVRHRFDDDIIGRLMDLSWWDWPVEMITRHRKIIQGADITALEEASKDLAHYLALEAQ